VGRGVIGVFVVLGPLRCPSRCQPFFDRSIWMSLSPYALRLVGSPPCPKKHASKAAEPPKMSHHWLIARSDVICA
jgi:hypothetical protein